MASEDPVKDYLTKISALQANIGTLQAQLRQSTDQIERLHRLQSAIVGMYLEFKDRSHEDASTRRNIDEEKAELLGESPLVILDKLRASLRVLLAFKEDFECELKAAISRQISEKDATAKDLSARLVAAQEKIRDLTSQLNNIRKYQEDSMDRERNIKKRADERNSQMETEIAQLKAKLDEKNTQIQGMKDLVAERDDLLRNRDTRLSRISQLESQLQLNRLQSQFDLSKVQTASRQKIIQLEKEALKFNRLEAENAELRERVRTMSTQLGSYQTNMQVKKTNSLEQELARCKQELEGYKSKLALKEERLRTTEANLAQSKLQVANLHQKISALAGDTTTSQPIQGKSTPKGNTSSPVRGSMSARAAKQTRISPGIDTTGDPHDVETSIAEASQQHIISSYKDKLKEKDLEIEELAKRVRRLLTLQHRSALSQRAWEEERTRLEKQISGLRDDVTQLRKIIGNKAMGQLTLSEDRQDAKDDAARDIQNLRAFAITTSHAFNQLQSGDKGVSNNFKRLNIQQLDPVIDPRGSRPLTSRPISSGGAGSKSMVTEYGASSPNRARPVSAAQSNKTGRGAGYGRGTMLGRTARMGTTYNFGLD